MDKVTIHISANEQLLTSAECPLKVASNTVSYIEAVFELGENWTGYDSVRAVWSTYMDTIATVLDSEGKCVVPHEVMTRTQKVFVNLVGSVVEDDELTDRLTTYPILAVVVNADALVEGTETAPITPSQFEQFVNEVSEEVSKIKDIVSTTLNDDYTLTFVFSDGTETTVGPIRGEQGEQGIQGIQGPPGPPGEVTLATLESLMPTDTANGSIASFPDGQSVFPLKSLVAEINPIQDLHGYDSPWVGGDGKNLIKVSADTYVNSQQCTSSVTDSGVTVTATGYYGRRQDAFNIEIGVTYTLSFKGKSTGDYNRVYIQKASTWYDADIIQAYTLTSSVTSRSYTFTATTNTLALGWYVTANSSSGEMVITDLQLEKGSQATTYEPYENICPISGWNSVGVVDCGVNIFDESVLVSLCSAVKQNDGTYYISNLNSAYTKKIWNNPTDYEGQLTITFIRKQASSGTGLRWKVYYTDGTNESIGNVDQNADIFTTYTLVTNASKVVDYIVGDYGSNKATYCNIQIEVGSTATTYEAYNGTTHTTTLPSTVYGGTLDVVSGELTVDRAIVNLGTLYWTYANSRFTAAGADNPSIVNAKQYGNTDTPNIICSAYATSSRSNLSNGQISLHYSGQNYINVMDSNYTDAPTFKSAMNGVQLVYELATPTTIQLTPTQVQTLLGTNNIFADSGDVSVEYVADIQGYIDKQ